MPGFPEKFMPFMNQPPGSLLSSHAISNYGKMIRALRMFTKGSMDKVPSWRRRKEAAKTGAVLEAVATKENISTGNE
jgi:hydrogenase small subunit